MNTQNVSRMFREFSNPATIEVRTKYVIPFEDFLIKADLKELSIVMPSSPSFFNADFVFHGVYIDIKGGQDFEGALTIRHILYFYYHHIFGIPVYVIVEGADKYLIINEYERIASGLPIPKSGKLSMRRILNGAKMFPIRVWQEGEEFFDVVKKILKDFTPNREYDRTESIDPVDFSFQTGEIYDYFLSASRNEGLSIEDIRKKLIDSGVNEIITDELLKRRVVFMEGFLSHIFG